MLNDDDVTIVTDVFIMISCIVQKRSLKTNQSKCKCRVCVALFLLNYEIGASVVILTKLPTV